MLQKLNERIQGWIAWIVLSLIAITFTLFGVDYYLQWHHAGDHAVTVNGEEITKQSVELSYRRQRAHYQPSQLAGEESQLKKQILQSMIFNTVSQQAAKKMGFIVSPDEAHAAILAIPEFQKDGHFSRDRYQQALTGAMFTPESFQNEVQQGMLLNQLRFAFIGTSFVLPNEMQAFVKRSLQKRTYEYVEISKEPFITQSDITDQDVKVWYDAHQQSFLEPETVAIEYLMLSMAPILNGIRLSEKELLRFYEENEASFTKPLRWKVESLLFKVSKKGGLNDWESVKEQAQTAYQSLEKSGQSFSSWMQKVPTDMKEHLRYLDALPWVSDNSPLSSFLKPLSEPGQITKPIKTEEGYQLFRLIKRETPVLKPFVEVKADIEKQIRHNISEAAYANALETLTELAYETPDTLTPASKKLHLPIEQTTFFSRRGVGLKLSLLKNPKVLKAAFSHDVLNLGNNSEPIQLDAEHVIVLRIKQHKPPRTKSLSEVRGEILDAIALERAEKKVAKLGELFTKNINDSATLAELKQPIIWQTVYDAKRELDAEHSKRNELVFTLKTTGKIGGVQLDNGNFVLVRLLKIVPGQYDALDREQQKSLALQLQSAHGLMAYELYVNHLVDTATIKKES